MNKRDAEREGKRLQKAIMDAIDDILFDAAPEPKGKLPVEMTGSKPILTKIEDGRK